MGHRQSFYYKRRENKTREATDKWRRPRGWRGVTHAKVSAEEAVQCHKWRRVTDAKMLEMLVTFPQKQRGRMEGSESQAIL